MKDVIQVKGDNILIRQDLPEGYEYNENGDVVSKLGIILSNDSASTGSMQNFSGEILAVGQDVTRFIKGDKVCWNSYMPMHAKISGKHFLIVSEHALPMKKLKQKDNYKPEEDEHIIE